MDDINLFSLITIASFFIAFPVVMLVEGPRYTPAALAAAGIDVQKVCSVRRVAVRFRMLAW